MARKDTDPGAREKAAIRRAKALKLRLGGASYRMIAGELGVSVAAAYEDVTRELAAQRPDVGPDADRLRHLEDARLDTAQRALVPKLQVGDLSAIQTWIKLSESRRRLWGLDAPIRQEVSGPGGAPLLPPITEIVIRMTDAPVEP